MNEDVLFKILSKKKKADLLMLLNSAWHVMGTNQRGEVFSAVVGEEQYDFPAAGDTVAAVKEFYDQSLAGDYYAPFDVNSKNFMDVPEETDAWFAHLDTLFIECTKLSRQGEYSAALEGFDMLYELTDAVDSGESIIFADEAGMWMFGGDEKTYYTAYLKAAASELDDDEFVEKALGVLQVDSIKSGMLKLYGVVKKLATSGQMEMIDAEVESRKLKVAG
ncbi:hypothetical protein [Endozoicomonas lisbonensis]|uniref:DUF4303 domain-containing protein n=1 Tax=Endozoicomonas lisbonensis TaxID=3120522 RepID=A0ABV2SL63_9GAMM